MEHKQVQGQVHTFCACPWRMLTNKRNRPLHTDSVAQKRLIYGRQRNNCGHASSRLICHFRRQTRSALLLYSFMVHVINFFFGEICETRGVQEQYATLAEETNSSALHPCCSVHYLFSVLLFVIPSFFARLFSSAREGMSKRRHTGTWRHRAR